MKYVIKTFSKYVSRYNVSRFDYRINYLILFEFDYRTILTLFERKVLKYKIVSFLKIDTR